MDEPEPTDGRDTGVSLSRRSVVRAYGALAFAPAGVSIVSEYTGQDGGDDGDGNGDDGDGVGDNRDGGDDGDDADSGEDDGARWRTGPPMPDPRTEVEAVERDGKFLVLGGITPERTATAYVAVYDPMQDSWSQRFELPEPLHHISAVVLDDAVHVLGGFADGFEPLDTHWVLRLGTWHEGPPLPTARGALTAEVLDGRIVAVGGANGDGPLGAVEIYDPGAESWESGADLPTPREHLASGVVDGTLYVAGGREGDLDSNLDANEAYDIEEDAWTEREPMPTARGGIDGSVRGGELFVFGGEGPDGTFEEVEAYNPEEDSWRELPDMPTPRHGLGTATLGEEIYTVSGGPEPGFAYSEVLEILSFEESS